MDLEQRSALLAGLALAPLAADRGQLVEQAVSPDVQAVRFGNGSWKSRGCGADNFARLSQWHGLGEELFLKIGADPAVHDDVDVHPDQLAQILL